MRRSKVDGVIWVGVLVPIEGRGYNDDPVK